MTEIGEAIQVSNQIGNPQPTLLSRPEQTSWFAIQTLPRHEKRVSAGLAEKHVPVFLPLVSGMHQWSDRRKEVSLPLFASYLFLQMGTERDERVRVLQTYGVLRFVGSGGRGMPIPAEQIEAVQTLLRKKIDLEPYPFLNIGQKVRVCGGSLDGIEGFLETVNGDRSLIISVESIERSVAVRISGYRVEPA